MDNLAVLPICLSRLLSWSAHSIENCSNKTDASYKRIGRFQKKCNNLGVITQNDKVTNWRNQSKRFNRARHVRNIIFHSHRKSINCSYNRLDCLFRKFPNGQKILVEQKIYMSISFHSFIYPYIFVFIHSSSFIHDISLTYYLSILFIYSLIYPFFLPYFIFKVKETSVSYPKSSVAVMPIFHATTTTPKHEHVNSLSTVDVKETPTTFYHWKLATKHAKAIPKVWYCIYRHF